MNGVSSIKNDGSKFSTIKLDLKKKPTQRGLRECASCGAWNGMRAQLCRNINCELRKKYLETYLAYEPIQLVTQNGINLYSVRVKERDSQPRNFVTIMDVTALGENTAIVSRNTMCYVSTCRNDADYTCKHVNACHSDDKKAKIPLAEVYDVAREVLSNLNINSDQKQMLWDLYKSEQDDVPAVQRLNGTTFAVKCIKSETFSAGRLHVTVVTNGVTKKKNYSCTCKALKIIVKPDNSLEMQDEVCDHLLLILAGILSKQNGKIIYGNFINAMKSFWMPEKLELPLKDVAAQDDLYLCRNINANNNFALNNEQCGTDDILIFGNELLVDDHLPDFTDVVLSVENTTTATTNAISTIGDSINTDLLYTGDPNLVSSCAIYEEDASDMLFEEGNNVDLKFNTTHLELTDCNIELMDQFQLTDQIDLCSDDITIPIDSEPINILAPSVFTDSVGMQEANAAHATLPLPPIELPTIAVVKEAPIKAANVVTEVKTRKHPHIPAKRAHIVNETTASTTTATTTTTTTGTSATDATNTTQILTDIGIAPALSYSAWLDYVIEVLNESVAPAKSNVKQVEHNFDVHKETFSHFSKSFSTGIKRRMPNETCVCETGKYKGLTKYTWCFTAAPTVKRIFTSKNIFLRTERNFVLQSEDHYMPFVPNLYDGPSDVKQKRIYPKLNLHTAQILFPSHNTNINCRTNTITNTKANNVDTMGFYIYWIPDVYAKSQFGALKIEFTLKTMTPNMN